MALITSYIIYAVVLYFLAGFKIVKEYERGVQFFLGKYTGLMKPGLRIVLPIIMSWERVDLRVKAVDVPDQDAITKDNVSITVNAVLYYKVSEASKAILEVEHYNYAVSQLAQTTMRDVVGEVTLVQGLLGSGVRGEVQREPRTGLREWWEAPDLVGNSRSMIGTGVHCVDDLEFILGQTVVEVAAITDGQTAEAPLENMVSLSLRFSGGAIGTMCCGNRMPDAINDVTVYGSNGRVLLKNASGPALGGTLQVTSETVNSEVSYEPDPLALPKWQIEGFNKAVSRDEGPRASGLDGLRSVQITEAMIESAKTRRTVSLEPIQV